MPINPVTGVEMTTIELQDMWKHINAMKVDINNNNNAFIIPQWITTHTGKIGTDQPDWDKYGIPDFLKPPELQGVVKTKPQLNHPVHAIAEPKKETVKKDYTKITVSDLYKYDSLNKYTGMEGNIPVRAGTTFVGVEIELEKVNLNSDVGGTWKMIEDNSLKDDGQEFVTIPIQFKYLEVELHRLFQGIKTCRASKRCSVHVHMNARDFTLEELKTFIALYMIFEKSFYNYSGNRWNNNFCVPLNFYTGAVHEVVSRLEDGVIREGWYKY
jgi:hypothetical protein